MAVNYNVIDNGSSIDIARKPWPVQLIAEGLQALPWRWWRRTQPLVVVVGSAPIGGRIRPPLVFGNRFGGAGVSIIGLAWGEKHTPIGTAIPVLLAMIVYILNGDDVWHSRAS